MHRLRAMASLGRKFKGSTGRRFELAKANRASKRKPSIGARRIHGESIMIYIGWAEANPDSFDLFASDTTEDQNLYRSYYGENTVKQPPRQHIVGALVTDSDDSDQPLYLAEYRALHERTGGSEVTEVLDGSAECPANSGSGSSLGID